MVGALARRCGIEVRLGEAPAAGVVARVLIPTSLLTEAPQKKAQDGPVLPAPRKETEVTAAELVAVAAEAKPSVDENNNANSDANRTEDRSAVTRSVTSAARTRNGLVKRPQRSAIADAVSETDRPKRPVPAEPASDRSPEEISGMLSTLRSAHMRGGISVEKAKREKQEQENRQQDEQLSAEQGKGDVK
ncbi:Signal transduction histidine-protein kinase/phosphatase MprB OS=Streptomyces griseorubiginosus OX=67304 GN=AQJ54_41230 PE=4 SV=1 [Streptomyces griseorubiginosus]